MEEVRGCFAYYPYIWRLSFFVRTEGNTYRLSYDPTPPQKSLAFGVGVKFDVLCMLRSGGHTVWPERGKSLVWLPTVIRQVPACITILSVGICGISVRAGSCLPNSTEPKEVLA